MLLHLKFTVNHSVIVHSCDPFFAVRAYSLINQYTPALQFRHLSSDLRIEPNSIKRTHGLCLLPDQTGHTDKVRTSVHVEIERTCLRPDKVRGLVGDPSCPWVWSGQVRVEEFRNDTTIPDKRQSLVGPV